MGPASHASPSTATSTNAAVASNIAAAIWSNTTKYPRTISSNSSGFFEDDETSLNPYQTPPPSPALTRANVPLGLQRHIVRMFSSEDASGTSAVAIDNKIEQAMDLVKSHLMIAVREEVEVLKEKISELMDKINQLEVENTILKANMSQETLQQLQMQTQLQIAGNGTPAGSNMIAAAPAPPTATQQQQQQQQTNAANTNATVVAAAASTTNATPATATAAATAPANDTAAAAATVVAAAGGNTVTTTNGPMS